MEMLHLVLISLVLPILFLLNRAGTTLARKRAEEEDAMASSTNLSWPKAALIIPVGGTDPRLETALRSLLSQDYPSFTPFLVTEQAHEHAAILIERLRTDFPAIVHVVAGPSGQVGQKNHNLLAGIAESESIAPDCYVFCDSTHVAKPNFLRFLLRPIATKEARLTTGYHEIVPTVDHPITLAYTASVLIMRLLQSLAVFTQPWGGALAVTRAAFHDLKIRELWSRTVVDDCALVPLLQERHCHVHLVAQAVLATHVERHDKTVFEAWMERQILFPRFCVPLQWRLLGLLLLCFFVPPALLLEDTWYQWMHGNSAFLAVPLGWCALMVTLILGLRRFLPRPVAAGTWLAAFGRAVWTFARVYTRTIGATTIHWQGKCYRVGKGGVVLEKRHIAPHKP